MAEAGFGKFRSVPGRGRAFADHRDAAGGAARAVFSIEVSVSEPDVRCCGGGAMPRSVKRKNPFGGEVYEHIKDKGSAVGNYIEMKGKDWGESCEPADAEKTFKLIVTDFSAMRTEWDDGIPSAGFQLTEAGTSGEAGNSTLKKKYSKEWGMDEFTMMSDLKSEFPLHYVVFRQVSSHMSHEGNVESVFALAKRLSHPCSKPRTVTLLTLMGANK